MTTETTGMSVEDMQRKLDRMRLATHRLQTAHNRTLNRLKVASQERDELRSLIEAKAGTLMYIDYELWCRSRGIPTAHEKNVMKEYAMAHRVQA